MSNTSKDKRKYNQRRFQNTELTLGGEKIYIHPAVKLALAWIVFILILIVFISVVKKGAEPEEQVSNSPENSTQAAQQKDTTEPASTDEGGTQKQITTPMEMDADPDLNQFVADYLTAVSSCDADTLKSMVTDPTVYDDMSVLEARTSYVQGYINLKCYSKAGPEENSLIVFAVTNMSLVGIDTAPMEFMTLYIEKTDTGYIINNYTQSDDVEAYIDTLKQDSDIQAVMRDIETYNANAIENDEGLKAFYEMLSQ